MPFALAEDEVRLYKVNRVVKEFLARHPLTR